jgi:hypothetical protein
MPSSRMVIKSEAIEMPVFEMQAWKGGTEGSLRSDGTEGKICVSCMMVIVSKREKREVSW